MEKLLDVVKGLFEKEEIDYEVETNSYVESVSFVYFDCDFEEIEYEAEVCLVIDEDEKTVGIVMNVVELENDQEYLAALKLCNLFNQEELLFKAYVDDEKTVVLEHVAHHTKETLEEHLFEDLDILFEYESFYQELLGEETDE